MTRKQVAKVGHGLYRINWKKSEGGGYSLASVGSDSNGNRWFAATNWISVPSFKWTAIQSVKLIEAPAKRVY